MNIRVTWIQCRSCRHLWPWSYHDGHLGEHRNTPCPKCKATNARIPPINDETSSA